MAINTIVVDNTQHNNIHLISGAASLINHDALMYLGIHAHMLEALDYFSTNRR